MSTRCARIWLLAAFIVPHVAQAQPPQPVVTFVFPAGAQRGQTVEATINGKDFQNASGVRITGPGVTAKIVQVVNPNVGRSSRSPWRPTPSWASATCG